MLEHFTTPTPVAMAAALAGIAAAGRASAQSTSMAADVRIAVPTLAIVRSVSRPREIARDHQRVEATTELVVDANIKYIVRARFAAMPVSGARVFVRDVAGVYQSLTTGAAVTVAAAENRGRTVKQVDCRVESHDARALDTGACALTFDFYTTDGALRLVSAAASP